jgi:tRNA(Ile)-lysidine synthase
MNDARSANVPSCLANALASRVPSPTRVVLAVSGGADSVALLRAWQEARPADTLIVATFDHGLREESALDANFVAQIALRLGLPFERGFPAHPIADQADSIESAARKARYSFLKDVARQHQAAWVATAHTADDQVETVLHRVIRGTGLRGLAGIPFARPLAPNILLVRPLLTVRRSDIETYLRRLGQDFRTDPTNQDVAFTRNRIRHELLPFLRTRFHPQVDRAIARLADLAAGATQAEQAWVDETLRATKIDTSDGRITLNAETLRQVDSYLGCAVIRRAIEQAGWPLGQVGQQQLRRVYALAFLPRGRCESAGRWSATKCRRPDTIVLEREHAKSALLPSDPPTPTNTDKRAGG